jgi:cystathionine beta-lyase
MGTAVILSKNHDLIARCQELNEDLHTFMGNCFGISAWQAAYGESEAWLDELLLYLKDNRDFIVNELPNILPSVKISPIEGTFLAWLDFRAYGLSETELIHKLRDDCRLALNAGSAFGSDGEGFMRLNFACPRSVLAEALQRLRAF